MLISVNLRPAKIKILRRIHPRQAGRAIRIYSYYNARYREFGGLTSAYNYHSANNLYVDYANSTIHKPLVDGRNTYYQGHTVVYFTQGRYYLIHGREISREELIELESVYVLPMSTMINRIQEIENVLSQGMSLNSVPETEVTQRRVNANLIYSYHTRGFTLQFKNHEDDAENIKKYFGIEVEIDSTRSIDTDRKNLLAARLNDILNRGNYNSFCKFENDGSLSSNGFEIITQPMTYKYILSKKEEIKQAFREIDSTGYTSHDNGRCGLHIHVSRAAIEDQVLDKIILLFENFKNEMIVFSRRTQQGMRWCQFIGDDTSVDYIDGEYINRRKRSGCLNSHGVVINNGNANTVEFRLFRGTTKYTTFMASIQLIDNIVEICTNKENIEGLTWTDIINYNNNYEELIRYNDTRSIISTHKLTASIGRLDAHTRAVILVRPFQLNLEGDRE